MSVNKELYDFLEAYDDDSLPDGAWQALLMEGVEQFNIAYNKDIDPHEGFMAYVQDTYEDLEE